MEVIIGRRSVHFSLSVPIIYHNQMLAIAEAQKATISAIYTKAVEFYLESLQQEQARHKPKIQRLLSEPDHIVETKPMTKEEVYAELFGEGPSSLFN